MPTDDKRKDEQRPAGSDAAGEGEGPGAETAGVIIHGGDTPPADPPADEEGRD